MYSAPVARKAVNLSLDAALVKEARAFGINISRACEEGLRTAVGAAKAERWREENRDAIASWNAWTRDNPLPLEDAALF